MRSTIRFPKWDYHHNNCPHRFSFSASVKGWLPVCAVKIFLLFLLRRWHLSFGQKGADECHRWCFGRPVPRLSSEPGSRGFPAVLSSALRKICKKLLNINARIWLLESIAVCGMLMFTKLLTYYPQATKYVNI